MPTLHLSTLLAVKRELVWEHASTLAGVNEELWPIHMSGPTVAFSPALAHGRVLFRSVLTVFRLLPVDVHALAFKAVWPGTGFHESSQSLIQRRWVHVRTIVDETGGCRVTDALDFEPRAFPRLTAAVVKRVFVRRHRVLQRKFRSLGDIAS